MKSLFWSFIFVNSICASSLAHNQVTVPLVKDISHMNQDDWRGVRRYHIPKSLIEETQLDKPSLSFTFPLDQVFFHNQYLYLCHVNCQQDQTFFVNKDKTNYVTRRTETRKRRAADEEMSLVRQATVYYWVSQLFEKLENNLGFESKRKLKVLVDREIPDAASGLVMENNAFFNPKDFSLSFLPARNMLLTRILGMNLRPSSFDPTVAVHEAGHAVFNELVQRETFNEEIGGLNEGFSDYMAYIVTGSSDVGTVMLSGHALRKLKNTKVYEPKLPVHDLGEVFAGLFYDVRARLGEEIADQAVINSVRALKHSFPHTAFSYLTLYREELSKLGVEDLTQIDILIRLRFPGYTDNTINYAFDEVNTEISGFKKVSFSTDYPAEISRQYGLAAQEKSQFVVLSSQKSKTVKDGVWFQIAYESEKKNTQFWILKDIEKNNILSIKDRNGKDFTRDGSYAAILDKLSTEFSSYYEWYVNKGSEYKSLLKRWIDTQIEDIGFVFKLRRPQSSEHFLRFNDQLIPINIISGRLRARHLFTLISLILGREAQATMKALDSVRLYLVQSDQINTPHDLPEIDDKTLVGVELRLKTGVIRKIMVTEIQ